MAEFTQNGVLFTTVKTAGVAMGQWPIFLAGQKGPDEDGGVINAVDIDWNGAQLNINGETQTINNTGELLKVIEDTQSAEVDLSGYVTIEAYNELFSKVQALELLVRTYHKHDVEPSENGGFTFTVNLSDPINIEELIDINAEKPEDPQMVDMTELTGPSEQHLIYPLDWEVYDEESDTLVSPKVYDENGFEIGVSWHGDAESSIVTYNNVQYRVLDITLGKGNYIIEF